MLLVSSQCICLQTISESNCKIVCIYIYICMYVCMCVCICTCHIYPYTYKHKYWSVLGQLGSFQILNSISLSWVQSRRLRFHRTCKNFYWRYPNHSVRLDIDKDSDLDTHRHGYILHIHTVGSRCEREAFNMGARWRWIPRGLGLEHTGDIQHAQQRVQGVANDRLAGFLRFFALVNLDFQLHILLRCFASKDAIQGCSDSGSEWSR